MEIRQILRQDVKTLHSSLQMNSVPGQALETAAVKRWQVVFHLLHVH